MSQKNGLLQRGGLSDTIWEDFAEETDALFDELANTKTEDGALTIILATFNDDLKSMAIFTHFRVRYAPVSLSCLNQGTSS